MVREITMEAELCRRRFNFQQEFDVVLACPFEEVEIPDEDVRRKIFDFYDCIGGVVRKLEKRPYLPHREIDLNWENHKIYAVPNTIVIPSSDIVLAYISIPSTAAGIMRGSAQLSGFL